ncbi:unnamed protein product [Orchesella dallaii]|uniref:Uncharacterized protein n=1 Tax=Orchesella dallaii TaxID=48710 RepID=A0ABP1Q1D1_9HEXA
MDSSDSNMPPPAVTPTSYTSEPSLLQSEQQPQPRQRSLQIVPLHIVPLHASSDQAKTRPPGSLQEPAPIQSNVIPAGHPTSYMIEPTLTHHEHQPRQTSLFKSADQVRTTSTQYSVQVLQAQEDDSYPYPKRLPTSYMSEPTLIQSQRQSLPKLLRASLDSLPIKSSMRTRASNLGEKKTLTFDNNLHFTDLPKIGASSMSILLGEALMNSFDKSETTLEETGENEPDHLLIIYGSVGRFVDENKNTLGKSTSIPPKQNDLTNNSNATIATKSATELRLQAALSRLLRKTSPYKIKYDPKASPSYQLRRELKKKKRALYSKPPKDERDMEWLYYSETEHESSDPEQDTLVQYGAHIQGSGETQSDTMLKEMSRYFNLLLWTGRMPFETDKSNPFFTRFYMNHASCKYWAYCVTSVLMTLVAGIMLGNFVDVLTQSTNAAYKQIEYVEFGNYWLFALFTLLNLWHVVITSLSFIFKESYSIQEYLTHWNCTVNWLNYDASFRLKEICNHGIYIALVYTSAFCAAMFVDELFADWNGCFGFISTLLFRNWIPKFRLSQYYGLLRWVGLFIHLYSLMASRLSTALLILYCRALENIARTFNWRLVGVLASVGQEGSDGKAVVRKRMVPCKRLFKEHVIIALYSRVLGQVFDVSLTALITVKALTMIVSSYSLLLILRGQYSSDANNTAIATLAKQSYVPINTKISLPAVACILSIISFFSWGEFWHTSECIRDAGEAIMLTYDFVKRYGLMLCKTSTKRRFILSLQNSYHAKNDYYIRGIHRPYIFGLMALLFANIFTLLEFSLQRSELNDIMICNSEGSCVRARYKESLPSFDVDRAVPKIRYMSNSHLLGYQGDQIAAFFKRKSRFQRLNDTQTTKKPKLTTVPPTENPDIKKYFYECEGISDGSVIERLKATFWEDKGQVAVWHDVSIGVSFSSPTERCKPDEPPWSKRGKELMTYTKFEKDYKSGDNTTFRNFCHRYKMNHGKVQRDDCHNIRVLLPDKFTGELHRPTMELVTITLSASGEASKEYYFCCYKWQGYNTICGLAKLPGDQTIAQQMDYVESRCPLLKAREKNENCKILTGGTPKNRCTNIP